jgi:hypothetical protein
MQNYRLYKKKYIEEFNIIDDLCVIKKSIFDSYCVTSLNTLINFFNEEYLWDKMFNIKDVENRLKNKNILFILEYKNTPIGYVWFKEIDKQTCYGYNLYVTKKIFRPKNSANWFYNKVSGIMLENYKLIEVEIEDWNNVVFDIVEKIGYEKY